MRVSTGRHSEELGTGAASTPDRERTPGGALAAPPGRGERQRGRRRSPGRAPYDVVISDFDLGEEESTGVEVVERLRIDLRDSQFVVMSGMPRQVPDWCDFVDKLDTDAFRAAVSPRG